MTKTFGERVAETRKAIVAAVTTAAGAAGGLFGTDIFQSDVASTALTIVAGVVAFAITYYVPNRPVPLGGVVEEAWAPSPEAAVRRGDGSRVLSHWLVVALVALLVAGCTATLQKVSDVISMAEDYRKLGVEQAADFTYEAYKYETSRPLERRQQFYDRIVERARQDGLPIPPSFDVDGDGEPDLEIKPAE